MICHHYLIRLRKTKTKNVLMLFTASWFIQLRICCKTCYFICFLWSGTSYINWIVIAIAIQVQAVSTFGVQVGSIVGRDEPTPLGGVIAGVAVIQAGIVIEVIPSVTDGICIGDDGVGGLKRNRTVALGILQIFPLYA